MNFNMTKPCDNCPFRADRPFPLSMGRVREILIAITAQQETFACHKTVDYGDDEPRQDDQTEHCAGALILLDRMNRPNQLMRWMERIGLYDRRKLDMDAPVYASASEMITAFDERDDE